MSILSEIQYHYNSTLPQPAWYAFDSALPVTVSQVFASLSDATNVATGDIIAVGSSADDYTLYRRSGTGFAKLAENKPVAIGGGSGGGDGMSETEVRRIVTSALSGYSTTSQMNTAIDAATANLVTQTEMSTAVTDAVNSRFIVVEELPATGVGNRIYLVPTEDDSAGNVYAEYVWTNSEWELIGSTSMDVSNFVQKSADLCVVVVAPSASASVSEP